MDLNDIFQSGKEFGTHFLVPAEKMETILKAFDKMNKMENDIATIQTILGDKQENITISELASLLQLSSNNLLNYIKKGILSKSVVKAHGKKLLNKKLAIEELREYGKIDNTDIEETKNFNIGDFQSIHNTALLFGIEEKTLRRAITNGYIADCIVENDKGKYIDIEKAKPQLREFNSIRLQENRVKRLHRKLAV